MAKILLNPDNNKADIYLTEGEFIDKFLGPLIQEKITPDDDESKLYASQYHEKLNELKGQYSNLPDIELPFDSTGDTAKHILRVNELLHSVINIFLNKADVHDRSKLSGKEKETFDKFTPKLAKSTYGSEEYKQFLKDMGPSLTNHYTENSGHHPDLLPNGINSMDLFDLIEMFCDWKAAGERHENGDIFKSIDINKKRFFMSDQLTTIFNNTVYTMFGRKKVNISLNLELFINNKSVHKKCINSPYDIHSKVDCFQSMINNVNLSEGKGVNPKFKVNIFEYILSSLDSAIDKKAKEPPMDRMGSDVGSLKIVVDLNVDGFIYPEYKFELIVESIFGEYCSPKISLNRFMEEVEPALSNHINDLKKLLIKEDSSEFK